jgi:hypothetical protein
VTELSAIIIDKRGTKRRRPWRVPKKEWARA